MSRNSVIVPRCAAQIKPFSGQYHLFQRVFYAKSENTIKDFVCSTDAQYPNKGD